MRLLIFIFCILSCAFKGFAYNIEPYSGESNLASKGILNLVFCSLHYQDRRVFLKDIDALIARLKLTKPFDESVGNIRFYYIVLSKEEEKLIFKQAEGFPPLKLRQNFLNETLAQLKFNYKLIILDFTGSVSCAELSSIDKLSLIILGKARYKNSQSFTKGFLHELGHSLGLRDECLDCSQLAPAGPPNCAPTKKEAEEWWGDLVGKEPRANYIGGCSGNKNYIRPTIASLMNDADKSEDFGPVNERYLKNILKGLREK